MEIDVFILYSMTICHTHFSPYIVIFHAYIFSLFLGRMFCHCAIMSRPFVADGQQVCCGHVTAVG